MSIAQRLQSAKDDRHLSQGEGEEVTEIPLNSYVLAKYPSGAMGNKPPSKLHTQWRGPFKVVNVQGSAYSIQNLITGQCQTLHISMLKPFYYDPALTDPANVALADKQLFIVERVLRHFGDPKKKRTLIFEVKWVGMDETTREPWSHLRDNILLHEYLFNHRDKKLKTLIPKHHRNRLHEA
jgi:hypothetical protein